ncbi:hypothetical protein F4778DRAFT_38324 [Xylariomycetidae sp. FL2044]|nr:hypothetical protein F4778DRAFT_38324 [Xylariomycetidae sp. FL2044]
MADIDYDALYAQVGALGVRLGDLIPRMDGGRWWRNDHAPHLTGLERTLSEAYEAKRLFVCCDGTWKNASGTLAPMTNVAKLARCVDRIGRDRFRLPRVRDELDNPILDDGGHETVTADRRAGIVRQITFYSSGVGSQSSLPVDSGWAGATGKGVFTNLLSAYCFLCNNYNFASHKDEIILVGFSRGAYTVRRLASFISRVGLLRRKALPFLRIIYKLWKQGKAQELETFLTNIIDLRGDSDQIKIKVLAEWDPVSAVGFPGLGKKDRSLDIDPIDTVPSAVEHAFCAAALDERRSEYQPEVWNRRRDDQTAEHCGFIGCHSDIGGGNPDPGLSTLSLLWMISKIEGVCGANFDDGALLQFIIPIRDDTVRPRQQALLLPQGVADEPQGNEPHEINTRNLLLYNLASTKGVVHEAITKWWRAYHVVTFGLRHRNRDVPLKKKEIRVPPDTTRQEEFDMQEEFDIQEEFNTQEELDAHDNEQVEVPPTQPQNSHQQDDFQQTGEQEDDDQQNEQQQDQNMNESCPLYIHGTVRFLKDRMDDGIPVSRWGKLSLPDALRKFHPRYTSAPGKSWLFSSYTPDEDQARWSRAGGDGLFLPEAVVNDAEERFYRKWHARSREVEGRADADSVQWGDIASHLGTRIERYDHESSLIHAIATGLGLVADD